MASTSMTRCAAQPPTWIGSSKARGREICRCSNLRSSSSSSTSRPPRRLALRSRSRCWGERMRSSSDEGPRAAAMGPGIANSRRKVVALILSGVFLGLGQFYNRQPLKGALFLAVGVVLSSLLVRTIPTDPTALVQLGAAPFVLLLVLLAIWLWSLVDARREAGR